MQSCKVWQLRIEHGTALGTAHRRTQHPAGIRAQILQRTFWKRCQRRGYRFWVLISCTNVRPENTRARRVLRCEPSLQANCRSRCCCSSCLSINDHSCSTSNLTKRTSQSNNFTRFRAQGYYHQNINSRSSFSSRHFMRQDKIAYCEIKCCVSSRTKQGMQQKPSRQTYMTWMSE